MEPGKGFGKPSKNASTETTWKGAKVVRRCKHDYRGTLHLPEGEQLSRNGVALVLKTKSRWDFAYLCSNYLSACDYIEADSKTHIKKPDFLVFDPPGKVTDAFFIVLSNRKPYISEEKWSA